MSQIPILSNLVVYDTKIGRINAVELITCIISGGTPKITAGNKERVKKQKWLFVFALKRMCKIVFFLLLWWMM